MRKSIFLFFFVLASAIAQVSPNAPLEARVVDAVRQKFGNVAAKHVSVEASKDGQIVIRGNFTEAKRLDVLSRIRRVPGVKSARWGLI